MTTLCDIYNLKCAFQGESVNVSSHKSVSASIKSVERVFVSGEVELKQNSGKNTKASRFTVQDYYRRETSQNTLIKTDLELLRLGFMWPDLGIIPQVLSLLDLTHYRHCVEIAGHVTHEWPNASATETSVGKTASNHTHTHEHRSLIKSTDCLTNCQGDFLAISTSSARSAITLHQHGRRAVLTHTHTHSSEDMSPGKKSYSSGCKWVILW